MSLVSGQLLHALSCRSSRPLRSRSAKLPPNPYLTGALTGSMALQWISLAIPGLRNLLHVTPLNLPDGVVIGSSAILPLVINEGIKQ